MRRLLLLLLRARFHESRVPCALTGVRLPAADLCAKSYRVVSLQRVEPGCDGRHGGPASGDTTGGEVHGTLRGAAGCSTSLATSRYAFICNAPLLCAHAVALVRV